jgi:hypothetical protein
MNCRASSPEPPVGEPDEPAGDGPLVLVVDPRRGRQCALAEGQRLVPALLRVARLAESATDLVDEVAARRKLFGLVERTGQELGGLLVPFAIEVQFAQELGGQHFLATVVVGLRAFERAAVQLGGLVPATPAPLEVAERQLGQDQRGAE